MLINRKLPFEVLEQRVLVFLDESVDVVDDIAGVMFDHEVLMEGQVLVLCRVQGFAGIVAIALHKIIYEHVILSTGNRLLPSTSGPWPPRALDRWSCQR